MIGIKNDFSRLLEQKKNKNLKDDTTNSTKIGLKLYRYDENGEPI